MPWTEAFRGWALKRWICCFCTGPDALMEPEEVAQAFTKLEQSGRCAISA
jgi:hypothetical protein